MGRKVFLVVILVAVVAVVAGSLVCVRKARAYGGDSWCGAFTSEQPILSGDYWTNGGDIAARDNHVYVVATPHVPGMNGVWFRRSDDYGSHWGNWIRVYESPPWDKCCPQIECGGADHSLYVAFNGHYNESSRGADIAVYKSGDNGDSWGLYHLLASYYNGTNLQEYIRPCLSSSPGSHNHVLLAYGDEWYDSALHGGYYASHVNIFQLENGSRNKGEGTLVSGGVWNFDIRCSVTGSGTYWVTWKEGNVSNGDIYTSHIRHIDGWPHWEYLENHTLLANNSSYPDIAALAGGVCVTYNRWDGQNNWAGQRVNFGTGWWGEGLMGLPNCNGGGTTTSPGFARTRHIPLDPESTTGVCSRVVSQATSGVSQVETSTRAQSWTSVTRVGEPTLTALIFVPTKRTTISTWSPRTGTVAYMSKGVTTLVIRVTKLLLQNAIA